VTKLAVMKAKKATGFVGWITYEIKDKESEWNKVAHKLEACGIRQFPRKQNMRTRGKPMPCTTESATSKFEARCKVENTGLYYERVRLTLMFLAFQHICSLAVLAPRVKRTARWTFMIDEGLANETNARQLHSANRKF